MSFDFQLQQVTQSRHVNESKLPHLLHVSVGEVLNASNSQTTLGTNEALRRRNGRKTKVIDSKERNHVKYVT